MKEFDYYIFIDYSENLIGYNIIDHNKLKELISKTLKFRHYKEVRNRKLYLKNIRKTVKKENIESYFIKLRIKEFYKNAEIYADVLWFLKEHNNCIIFISVDNRQFKAFSRLIGFIDGKKIVVKKESELVKGTLEYQASVVLDNLLNIKRLTK